MKKAANYILLGPQGSGKGEQAILLAKRLGAKIIAAGDIARALSEQKNEQGRRVRKRINQGLLIENRDLIPAVENAVLAKPKDQSIIFDAFPRNLAQAQALEKIISKANRLLPFVIYLKISEKTAQKRIAGRKICQKCQKIYKPPDSLTLEKCSCGGKLIIRSDDQPAAIAKRLKIYEQDTLPILDYYRQKGLLIEIDGEPPIEKVWEQIEQRI